MENEEFQSGQQPPVIPTAPPAKGYNELKQAPVMKVKDWLIIYLIMLIPIVNIVMLFVWAFNENINPNKSNWAKASLIWLAIVMVLYILLIAAFGASIMALMQGTAGVSVY